MFIRTSFFLTPLIIMEVSIGTRLRQLRKQANLTQVQLAAASGVQQGEIAGYENDKRVPTAPKIAALAKALHVPMEALMEDFDLPQVELTPTTRAHGNSTEALIQKITRQLNPDHQKAVLAHAKALLKAEEADTEPKRTRKVA